MLVELFLVENGIYQIKLHLKKIENPEKCEESCWCFDISIFFRQLLSMGSKLLYGIFVFAQYFVSPPHCVRRIRLTKKCEHEKIGPQNSDQSSFLK